MLNKNLHQKCLQKMIEAAHAAGAVLVRHFNRPLQIRIKRGAGLVTQVDLAAETAAVSVLRKAFPEFGFLTEEGSPKGSPPPKREPSLNTLPKNFLPKKSTLPPARFIIDPLDGTTNYVHRFPMFCVSIAAEMEGKIIAGVIYHPILKDTYTAIVGGGAFVNGEKISVSTTRSLKNSLLTTGFSYRKEMWLRHEMKAFEQLSKHVQAVRRPGSAALDLAYTARGVFDGFWERSLSPWDIAAGSLLVQEAGGQVTDFSGNPIQLHSKEILASNGLLHTRLSRAGFLGLSRLVAHRRVGP